MARECRPSSFFCAGETHPQSNDAMMLPPIPMLMDAATLGLLVLVACMPICPAPTWRPRLMVRASVDYSLDQLDDGLGRAAGCRWPRYVRGSSAARVLSAFPVSRVKS